tara:strand:+ start:255 stop:458 length:204 start_codon:yes stop_codon:yes gene_type:complete
MVIGMIKDLKRELPITSAMDVIYSYINLNLNNSLFFLMGVNFFAKSRKKGKVLINYTPITFNPYLAN